MLFDGLFKNLFLNFFTFNTALNIDVTVPIWIGFALWVQRCIMPGLSLYWPATHCEISVERFGYVKFGLFGSGGKKLGKVLHQSFDFRGWFFDGYERVDHVLEYVLFVGGFFSVDIFVFASLSIGILLHEVLSGWTALFLLSGFVICIFKAVLDEFLLVRRHF